MSTDHAPLAPSSAKKWGNCSGSIRAQREAKLPKRPHERTLLGTAAHWVIEGFLKGKITRLEDMLSTLDPNGTLINDEIIEGASVFIEDVNRIRSKLNPACELHVEKKVFMKRIHPTSCWGTPDTYLYDPSKSVIYLWDYKHGHEQVEAYGNLAMICYLQGIIEKFQINGFQEQQITAVIRIVQPFCYRNNGPVDQWVLKLSELRPYINQLRDKAEEALGPAPLLSAGPWCSRCDALHSCPAVRQAGYRHIQVLNQPYELDSMSGQDLAIERDILRVGLKLIQSRIYAIEAQLEHQIRNGDSSSGLTLQTGRGKKEWKLSYDQVISMFRVLGIDPQKKVLKTPKQVLDSVETDLRPVVSEIFKEAVKYTPGALNLVQADKSKAARAFKPK